jgi:hypothetical protein
LQASNIDVFKHSLKLADISVTKAFKKRSILEEILKSSSGMSSNQGRPIIVVPGSDYPGNISMKNAIQFLSDGTFVDQS